MQLISEQTSISKAALEFYKLAKDLENHTEIFVLLDQCFSELFKAGSVCVLQKDPNQNLTSVYQSQESQKGSFYPDLLDQFINSSKSFYSHTKAIAKESKLICYIKLGDESLDEYFIEVVFNNINNWREDDELILEMISDSIKTKFQQSKALQDLNEAMVNFKSIFKNNDFGITIVNLDGTYDMANPAFCNMVGYSLEELNKIDFTSLTHYDSLNTSLEKFKEIKEGKINFYEIEKTFIKKDNSLVYCKGSVTGLYDDQKNLIKVICTIQDISKEKKYLKSLKESEDRYKKIFENNVFPIFLFDAKNQEINANPALCKLLSYSKTQLKALSLSELVEHPDPDELNHILNSLFEEKKDEIQLEVLLKRSDQKTIKTIIKFKAMKSSNNKVEGVIGTVKDLSPTQNAIESIQLSDLKFMNLFEKSKVGIMFMDKELNFNSPNPEMCRMLKYSREELLSLSFKDILGKDDIEKASNNLYALQTGEISTFSMECAHIQKGGDKIWGIATVSGIYRHNELSEILVYLTDTTELRTTTELLLESEYKFKLLFNNKAAGVLNFDKDWNLLTVNPTFTNMIGYTVPELISTGLQQITHPSYRIELNNGQNQMVYEKLEELFYETVYIRKDGSPLHALTSIKGHFNQYNDFLGAIATIIDIDERKKALRDGAISELKYQAIFENAHLGILIFERDSQKITSINDACLRILGYPNTESIMGKTFDSFIPENQSSGIKTRTYLKKYLKDIMIKRNTHFEMELVKMNGEIFFGEINSFFMPPDEKYTINVIQDLTKEKLAQKTQEEMRSKQIELDAKNRELASYTLFLTQKNQSLNELANQLKDLNNVELTEIKTRIRRIANKINNDVNNQEDWLSFRIYFENIYPSFFDNLMFSFPNLTHNEQRLCAYIKMKLSNREVANLLYISIKAVETARYRLKKKLGLKNEVKLNNYINNLGQHESPSS
jgi:PAS domain S-box-containing protein